MYSSFLRFFLLLFGFGLFANGCGCGDAYTDFPLIRFNIQEQTTGKNLYGWNGTYSADSVKIDGKDNTDFSYFNVDEDNGNIDLVISRTSNQPNEEWVSTFYFSLNSIDTDTITFMYEYEVDEKCNTVSVNTMKAFYNGQIYEGQSPLLYFEFLKK